MSSMSELSIALDDLQQGNPLDAEQLRLVRTYLEHLSSSSITATTITIGAEGHRDPACWICGNPDEDGHHDGTVTCEDGPLGEAYRTVMTELWKLCG